jgi:hypothetical protein
MDEPGSTESRNYSKTPEAISLVTQQIGADVPADRLPDIAMGGS